MERNKKVFVSSTYGDLLPERRAVKQCMEQLKQGFIFAGMEISDNQPLPPLDTSLKELYGCSTCIVIVGRRYGEGITEKEFDHAYKNKTIKLLVYIKRDSAGVRNVETDIDLDPEKQNKLGSFKEKLRKNTTYKEFNNDIDLPQIVQTDLLHVPDDGKSEQLKASPGLFNWLTANKLMGNPYANFSAQDDPFLWKYFVEVPPINKNKLIVDESDYFIFGAPGVGKTALHNEIARNCFPHTPDGKFFAVPFTHETFYRIWLETNGKLEKLDIGSYIRSIVLDGTKILNFEIENKKDRERLLGDIQQLEAFVRDSASVEKFLQSPGKALEDLAKISGHKILCLVDEVDETPDVEKEEEFALLVKPFMKAMIRDNKHIFLRIFLPDNLLNHLKHLPHFDNFKIVELESKWNLEKIEEMVDTRLQTYVMEGEANKIFQELCDNKIRGTIIKSIAEIGEYNPRKVLHIIDDMISLHTNVENPSLKIGETSWLHVREKWPSPPHTPSNKEIKYTSKIIENGDFHVAAGHVFRNKAQLQLSKRSEDILIALLKAKNQFCSKKQLIAAGWPQYKNTPEIDRSSEEHKLRQAITTLRKELKEQGCPSDRIKSVSSEGYRFILKRGRR